MITENFTPVLVVNDNLTAMIDDCTLTIAPNRYFPKKNYISVFLLIVSTRTNFLGTFVVEPFADISKGNIF